MTDEQLQQRRQGVGSTDAGPILGLSPKKTALEVYADKVNGHRVEANEAMRIGLKLEPLIGQLYCEETGVDQLLYDRELHRNPDKPWQICSLDFRAPGGWIVEAKAVGPYAQDEWGEPGTDEIPRHYLAQVQHQMAVTGADRVDVAALFAGQSFRVYTVRAEMEFIRIMTEREAAFWERVMTRRPPEPDWSHMMTPEAIRLLYGYADVTVQLSSAHLALVNEYLSLGSTEKQAKEDREVVKAKLLYAMQDATRAELPDGTILTRKSVDRKGYEVKATSYLDFRVKRPKGVKNERDENSTGASATVLSGS